MECHGSLVECHGDTNGSQGVFMEGHRDTHGVPWGYSWSAMGILLEFHKGTHEVPWGY